MKKMPESELQGLVAGEVRSAIAYCGGELSEQRRQALEMYRGDKVGDLAATDPNRSSVVMRDIADTIEWIMPALMKIFASGDDVVRFEATGPEDEEAAKQATEYVNWVFNRDNDGFTALYAMFKDALLQKNGVLKVWWEDKEEDVERTLYALDDATYQIIAADPDIEIIAHSEIAGDALPMPGEGAAVEPLSASPAVPAAPPEMLHDVTYRVTRTKGRVCIEPVPPEEFLIARRAKDISSAPYVGHRTRKLISDLIAEGYDREMVEDLPTEEDSDTSEEVTRWDGDDTGDAGDNPDRKGVLREVWVYESYVLVDYDGDGIAERRQIVSAGPAHKILSNEAWDGPPPFASVTPVINPHKFFGMSIPDLISDLQVIKSTVMRQTLDNLYLSNNPRNLISDEVNLDDYLTPRPGGAIRMNTGARPADGHIVPMTIPFMGAASFNMMEYLDTVKENRTGVTRYNQGIDANSLNKTATGINAITNAAQQRIELIARIFAETGVKDVFRLILRLVSKYQDKPRTIRLRNKWVPVDPRAWENGFDLTIAVGLGTGNRDQMAAHLQNLLAIQMQAVQMQGGVQGPFVTGENLYNTVSRLIENMGLKSPELYFTDPAQNPQPQQPPQPDPEMVKLQQEMQLKQAELQMTGQFKAQELQFKEAELAATLKLKEAELGANMQLQQQKQAGDFALKQEAANAKQQPANNIILGSDGTAAKVVDGTDQLATSAQALMQMMTAFVAAQAQRDAAQDQQMQAFMQMLAAPKEIIRDANGRPAGVRTMLN